MGGIETYTAQLVDLLKTRNIETDIYHTGQILEEHGLHNDYLGRLYLTGRKVLASDEEYDLVIANAFYGLGYFPPKAKTYNIFHLTHMGFAEEIKGVVPMNQYLEWRLLWGEFCESVSAFNRLRIAVSESVKDELRIYYGIDDADIVHNCLDVNAFVKQDREQSRRKWGIPGEAFVGLYVGRWDVLKGCDILKNIMAGAPDVYWTVVLGTGSDKGAVPMPDNIRVIEQAAHENMKEIYSAADFMLFPSRYEGFGYVIIEAMACELPVITANVGIAKTICKKGPFREMLLPDYSSGMEEIVLTAIGKIEYLRKNKDWKEHIVKEGRRLMEQEFDIKQWKEKIIGILGL